MSFPAPLELLLLSRRHAFDLCGNGGRVWVAGRTLYGRNPYAYGPCADRYWNVPSVQTIFLSLKNMQGKPAVPRSYADPLPPVCPECRPVTIDIRLFAPSAPSRFPERLFKTKLKHIRKQLLKQMFESCSSTCCSSFQINVNNCVQHLFKHLFKRFHCFQYLLIDLFVVGVVPGGKHIFKANIVSVAC